MRAATSGSCARARVGVALGEGRFWGPRVVALAAGVACWADAHLVHTRRLDPIAICSSTGGEHTGDVLNTAKRMIK